MCNDTEYKIRYEYAVQLIRRLIRENNDKNNEICRLKAKKRSLEQELRFNPNHDPKNGRFTHKNAANSVDISGESGIINYAKVTDVFSLRNYSDNSHIDLKKVLDLLETSDIGKTALSQLSEKGVKPVFDYSKLHSANRGEQQGKNIKINICNIINERVAAQTVIHETTHLYYDIGQNQWAEAVCFAKEKMFLTGRSLTVAERRYIVKLEKDTYPEFNWKKGGYGYGK